MMNHITEQDLYERYAERAAIMEFDAGFTRQAASQSLFNQIAAWCKKYGYRFPQSIRDDYRKVITGK